MATTTSGITTVANTYWDKLLVPYRIVYFVAINLIDVVAFVHELIAMQQWWEVVTLVALVYVLLVMREW
ncbi:hypothetical protein HAX54_015920 [Datura stramonium]|uniref:Uncharacterized protein n=1 Tax=Datura stramonium TaxID=4076 RepID=A0ABS8UI11_DATST|nr:hypothetical protein [Datura stramonium]